MILSNVLDRESWTRERTIDSMKSNKFLIENDIVKVAEDGNFYLITSEQTDIPLLKEGLYAKVKPSNMIGNSTTSDRLKVPVDINLIGNVEGTTSFDGSQDVNIDVKVKQLETPREIKLTGELEGSSLFDGSKNIEIFSLVHKLHVPRNIELIGEVEGNVNFDGSEDVTINSIVNKLHIPRNIKLTGEIEGNVDFDGSKNVEINSIVNKLHTPRTIELTGDTIGNVQFDGSRNVQINTTTKDDSHNHTNSTILSVDASKVNTGVLSTERIPNLDASKITSGIIDIERLPSAALERLVEVSNDSERFRLTKQQVQLGDVVKVRDTLKMYKVINDDKLNSENGYSVFVAGRAAEVPWSGVTGKPNNYPPSSHTHTKAQITDFPTSLKNPTAITIQANGTSLGSYDGSSAKTFNITASNVGASASNHTHTAGAVGAYTKAEVDSKLSGKANSSHGNHVPATQSANNKIFLRNDNTWQTITPANIGASNIDHIHDERYYTESEINTKLNGKANTSGTYNGLTVGSSTYSDLINGVYTGNGGQQSPSYIPSGKVRFNMMNTPTNGDTTYKDWILMDTYGGGDVPYVTGFGISKSTSLKAFIMQGSKNGNSWDRIGELWHTANFNPNTKFNTSGGTISGNVSVTGTLTASKVYNAVWNDYAELFERGEQTEAGDIICLDTSSPIEQYIKADCSSKRVIGVHSDTYGHLIGGEKLENFEDNFEKFIPVGLAGRVNVKVKGKVELGDYIVPSEEKGIGRAYNKETDDRDLIIGYLVESDEREDIRRLKMFINKK